MAVSIGVSCWENSTDIANNRSQVGVSVWLTTTGESYNDHCPDIYGNIWGSISGSYDGGGIGHNQTVTMTTQYGWVYHNADGSGYAEVGANAATGMGAGTITGYASCNLTKFDRRSSLSGVSASAKLNDTITMTVSEVQSSLTTKIKYTVGNTTGYISENASGSVSWKIPSTLASEFNDSTKSCTITCQTYDGSTLVGSKDYTVSLECVPCYLYNGTEWKMVIPYVYNGSEWKQSIPYVYNGSEWKL